MYDGGVSERQQHARVQERFTRTAQQFAAFSQGVRAAEAAQLLELLRRSVAAANVKAELRTLHALDVACGPGTFTLAFAPHVAHVTGLDITPAILEKGRSAARQQNLVNISWALGKAEKLPWPAAAFDVVTMAYGLHHIGDAAQAVREMARVLKPGGWLALVDVSLPTGADADVNNAIEIARDASHVRTYSAAELAGLAEGAGLRVGAAEGGARPRMFDDWMQIAGWRRGDAAYGETRRLMEQNFAQDRSGFAPQRPATADGDFAWTQPSAFLVAGRPR